MFQLSMRYTPSGRKKKALPKVRKRVAPFKELQPSDTYRRETPEYKSVVSTSHNCGVVAKPKLSSTYTIAPAYNKGAYQVISRDNIKDIGR